MPLALIFAFLVSPAAAECSPSLHTDADCAKLAEIDVLARRLAAAAGVKGLKPTEVRPSPRVSASADIQDPKAPRLVVTTGLLRDPGAPEIAAGFLAHELGHVLHWEEDARSGLLHSSAYKGNRQVEASADALGMIILARAGLEGDRLHASQVAGWSCADIQVDDGGETSPPRGYRWTNAALLRERVAAWAAGGRPPLESIPLEAFRADGWLEGSFLAPGDPALAAALDGGGFRGRMISEGCGRPSYRFEMERFRETMKRLKREAVLYLVDKAEWDKAKNHGPYRPSLLAADGALPVWPADRVAEAANRLFPGKKGLAALVIDPRLPGVPLERSPSPRLRGPIEPAAVVDVYEMPTGSDGRFTTPPALR